MIQNIKYPLGSPLIIKPVNKERTSLTPTFLWTSVNGADAYEFVIAEEIGNLDKFAIIDYAAVTTVNGHIIREILKQNATYFWHVRAVAKDSKSPWALSSFATRIRSDSDIKIIPTKVDEYPPPSVVITPSPMQISLKMHNIPWDYQSVFISYGNPDEEFAKRINRALQERGINTFFFPQHAIPGQKLHRLMHEGVNRHRHVLLICSVNSLNRPGVMNELEETLQREAREGGSSILIPITIDDYVFKNWKPDRADIAQSIRDRVISNFSDAINDPILFNKEVERLIIGITTIN